MRALQFPRGPKNHYPHNSTSAASSKCCSRPRCWRMWAQVRVFERRRETRAWGQGRRNTSFPLPLSTGEQPALTPRRLTLYNTATRATIQELPFGDAVGGVRLNRAVAVAVAGPRASVFALETLDRLAVLDVPENAAVSGVKWEG